MHEYTATVSWARNGANFLDRKFSRGHVWRFDGGVEVPASSAPGVVRPPLSVVEAVDPEEALVASASSCHMMTFLFLAAKAGFVVDSYADEAVGVMTANEAGRYWVSKITLRPAIAFSGDKLPTEADLAELHHHAHEECYIANSIRSETVVEPRHV